MQGCMQIPFVSISKRQKSVGNSAKLQSLFAAYGQQERNANANARDSCRLKVFPDHSHGTVLLQNASAALHLPRFSWNIESFKST